jgi:hypothetical protein
MQRMEKSPFASIFYVCFIHAPAHTSWVLVLISKFLFEQGGVFNNPTIDGCMIN